MITDGTFECELCGEWRTGCHLCGTAPLVDRREDIARDERHAREAEHELANQERSIRREAERRRGLID